ncbi:hypothetical protein [Microbacterium saperdae]|uniref:Uncharacterized protein n=1 Tax=Microbacterium saperdae TaxID=69368 RepID=A0A543BQU6_9MICO|nr:hypothetical protein [Microbacterium saperdae]TQL87192.1 hypothetical protein FB560_2859 [Microbacterium saperdae]GGM42174.1 hypothetical protein GCM10010489_11570 [Microbacterium saperdae]
MDISLINVFAQQIITQAHVALHGRAIMHTPAARANGAELWLGAQLFLTGSGNIAKAFWGSGRAKGKRAAERAALREALGVADGSALEDVTLRNKFEHFDEAIDEWWGKSTNHNFLDQMAFAPHTVRGLEPIEMFRMYDPEADVLYFWGEEFPLRHIEREIRAILETALAFRPGPGIWVLGEGRSE